MYYPAPQKPRRSRNGKLLIVVLVFIALIVGATFLIPRLGSDGGGTDVGPADGNGQTFRQTTDAFMKLLVASDADGSYAMLTKNCKSKVTSEDWAKQVSSSFNGQNATFKFVTYDAVPQPEAAYGKNATPYQVRYDVTFGSSGTWRTIMVVTQDDGSWKIDEMQSYKL